MEPMSLGSPTSSPSSPPSWGSGPPLHSLSLASPIAPYHHHGAYNSPLQQQPYSGFNSPQQQQHQPVQHPHQQQQQQQSASQSGFLPGFLMGEPVKHSSFLLQKPTIDVDENCRWGSPFILNPFSLSCSHRIVQQFTPMAVKLGHNFSWNYMFFRWWAPPLWPHPQNWAELSLPRPHNLLSPLLILLGGLNF